MDTYEVTITVQLLAKSQADALAIVEQRVAIDINKDERAAVIRYATVRPR